MFCQLPLHLYLLRDIGYKLDFFSSPNKAFSAQHVGAPSGLGRVTVSQFIAKIEPLFPAFKKYFDSAVSILKEGRFVALEFCNMSIILLRFLAYDKLL